MAGARTRAAEAGTSGAGAKPESEAAGAPESSGAGSGLSAGAQPVSYTHLTLPTNREV